MADKFKYVTVRLRDITYKKLTKAAKETGVKRAAYVRELIVGNLSNDGDATAE